MRADWTHKGWLIFSLVILLFASGCFQSAGGALESTSVAQSAPTFTPTFTETPPPSPTEYPSLTPTDDESIIVLTRVVTETPSPTYTPSPGLAQNQGTEVAGFLQQDDIVAQTSTAIYLTQNAQFFPTATTEFVTDPLLQTATVMIRQATDAAALPMTLTAQAMFGITPTLQGFPTATLAPGQPTAIIPVGADCVHEVRATDRNLFRIGLYYGVTYQTIAQYNSLVNANLIYVGQRLVIPGCGTTGNRPPATSTATTTSVFPVTTIPGGGTGGSYIVQDGDTLYKLSQSWGVRVVDIAAVNGITNVNLIYIGQSLVIP
jgi:LysM repeat protein